MSIRIFSLCFILLLALVNTPAIQGQVPSNPIPREYDVPMQRLLLYHTGYFIYGVTQGQMELDSAMTYAAGIYNLNRLLLYNERYDAEGKSASGKLIGENKIREVKVLLSATPEAGQQQILAELGAYYIFKAGQVKRDLDEAEVFIRRLKEVNGKTKDRKWNLEALILEANLKFQQGQYPQSQEIFARAVAGYKAMPDTLGWITALSEQATHLPFAHKDKMPLLEEALRLSQKAGFRIKEDQVTTEIIADHFRTDPVRVKAELLHALELQKALGFKHLQYIQNVLAYLMLQHRDMEKGLRYAEETIKSMEITHDQALASIYCQRLAEMYGNYSLDSAALYWNQRALNNRTRETQIFWYKSFLERINWLNTFGRASEALVLIDSVTANFPPETLFDRMYLTSNRGFAFWRTRQFQKADAEFSMYMALTKQFPPDFAFAEVPQTLVPMTRFYIEDMRDYQKARAYAEVGIKAASRTGAVTALSDLHWALFKIDSIQGNYLSSIDHLRKHRIFLDSIFNEVQRKKLNELRVQYETSRKDQDIKYLKQQGELKEARLQQAGLTRNITLAGVFLLLVILGLLYGQYRGKQRTNEQLQGKQQEISRKNEALEQLVEDKEWLVKEIHHRVKNNLHTIVSLLESQSAFLGNDALAAVRDSQHRVYAMSLIHQKLYLSEDVTTVNMDIYVKELVSYLQESFDISQKVRFMVETNDINLDAGTAIPLGLVLNEAITNSIKYAFPERTGFVTVKLDKTGEDFELAITDNGVGLPHDFDITKSKTLGMRLIKGLTKELGGTFSIGSYSSGTTVSVIFRERVLRRLREIQHVQAEV